MEVSFHRGRFRIHFHWHGHIRRYRCEATASRCVFCRFHDDLVYPLNLQFANMANLYRGTSAPSVLLDVWYNNNIAHEGRRLILTSVAVPLANLMGVVSSNIFRNEDAPKYIPALATTAAFGGMGFVLTMCLGFWMMADNKRRDRRQGVVIKVRDIPTARLRDGPKAEEFRWFL
jgi:hypothetical protein